MYELVRAVGGLERDGMAWDGRWKVFGGLGRFYYLQLIRKLSGNLGSRGWVGCGGLVWSGLVWSGSAGLGLAGLGLVGKPNTF